MKAAVFHGPGQPLTIEQVDIDQPKEREVLVRTVASGVCHSDLHFVDGLYMWPTPAVLGHEAAGVVEKVGSQVSYLKPGDHVIACLSVFCGYCEECMSGHPNLCSNKAATQRGASDQPRLSQKGQMVNQFADLSGYAEKMLLHENALVKISDDVPLDRAALIGCGVMTGVGAALNTAKVAPGSTVAACGAGGGGRAPPPAASPRLSEWFRLGRKSTWTASRCCTRSASRDASWARTASASTCRASSSSISRDGSTSTT